MRAFVLALIVLAGFLHVPAMADAFTGTGSASAPEAPTTAPSFEAAGSGGMLHWLAHRQMLLNQAIADQFHAAEGPGADTAIATILGLAFFYGVLHAAGPGHGKSVVASFFVANEARWTAGIFMGGLISLLQGVTAVVIVFLLSLVLQTRQMRVQDRGALVEFVSYGLVTLIGLVMLWRAATGRGHLHSHGPIGHGHDHHHHDGHDHDGHKCDDHHAHHHAPVRRRLTLQRVLIAAAGVAPCASAIIIMLFALANNAFGLGMAAVAALSLGMGMTVSAIGVLSIVARKSLKRIANAPGVDGEQLERGLSLVGAAAVVVFAGALALGAWSRL